MIPKHLVLLEACAMQLALSSFRKSSITKESVTDNSKPEL